MKVEIAFGFCVLMKTDEYLRYLFRISTDCYTIEIGELLLCFFYFVLWKDYLNCFGKYVLTFKELLIREGVEFLIRFFSYKILYLFYWNQSWFGWTIIFNGYNMLWVHPVIYSDFFFLIQTNKVILSLFSYSNGMFLYTRIPNGIHFCLVCC